MAAPSSSRFPPLEKYVALDCEMIQLRNCMGLAKIGIVDVYGNVLMESFVRHHPANVVNYVTRSMSRFLLCFEQSVQINVPNDSKAKSMG